MTYEEYVAQKRALDPGYGYAAPEGMYWNQLGTATPLSSADQWAAGQARNAEIQASGNIWQANNPWYEQGVGGGNSQINKYYQQDQAGNFTLDSQGNKVPIAGVTEWQAAHAYDTPFLQRFPTEQDYVNYVQTIGDPGVGATGGGIPILGPDGNVQYDTTTGMGPSPAEQAITSASQGILANSLGAGNFQVPQTPQQGLLGPVGAPPQGLASNPVRDLNYQELKTPAGLWGGLLDTVQNAGPYTSGNMGFRSPYWNPEPYRTGWDANAFGTGYAQLNEMIGNAPAPTQVPFVSPEVQQPVVNNYYGYDPYAGTYTEGGGGGLESGYTGAEVSEGSQGYSGNDPEGAANESFGAGDAHAW